MISLVAALLLAAGPTDAAPQPAAQPAAAQPAAPAKTSKTDKICWDETPTGTRFSHRVCATREDIDQRRRDDQDWKMRLRLTPAGAK